MIYVTIYIDGVKNIAYSCPISTKGSTKRGAAKQYAEAVAKETGKKITFDYADV